MATISQKAGRAGTHTWNCGPMKEFCDPDWKTSVFRKNMDSCRQDWAPRGKLQWIPPKGVALGTSAEDGGRVLGTEGPEFLIF